MFAHSLEMDALRRIGAGTLVWACAHVQEGGLVGSDCDVGEHCFIENGEVIGDRVTIKNGLSIREGIRVWNDVLLGPNATLTSARYPRSPRSRAAKGRYANRRWSAPIVIGEGCSVWTNATVLGPIRHGRGGMISTGPLLAGNPGCPMGWVNAKDERLVRRRVKGGHLS